MDFTIAKTCDSPNWIVLVHGLGVSEKVWFAPLEEKVLFISFRRLLPAGKGVIPFADRCRGLYNVASWSQDTSSSIDEAAQELKGVMESLDAKKVVFVAHSRGGLVARRAIQNHCLSPAGLICLASPHGGSGFADLVIDHLSVLRYLVPSLMHLEIPIRELCKAGSFIAETNGDERLAAERHVPHFDITGDSTRYISVRFPPGLNWIRLFDIMGSIEGLLGDRTLQEWRAGFGDGFVSMASARSPLTPDEAFFRLAVNHLSILIDNRAWGIVNSILQRCFSS